MVVTAKPMTCWVHDSATKVMLTGILLGLQVGIIRQVEVELDNTLRDLRDSHKEENAKLKKWRALDKDVQAKLADFPIQGRHSLCSLSIRARLSQGSSVLQ